MTTIEIDIQNTAKAEHTRQYLQKIADKITIENLKFLAELADKPQVNEKLQKNKMVIKVAL